MVAERIRHTPYLLVVGSVEGEIFTMDRILTKHDQPTLSSKIPLSTVDTGMIFEADTENYYRHEGRGIPPFDYENPND
ncbi:MAG: hypothetical protein HYT11_01050 [Candidatus Levybacteria bacterium]|nr:hypothetical protein [Candidatus Levybacteria bacterium]